MFIFVVANRFCCCSVLGCLHGLLLRGRLSVVCAEELLPVQSAVCTQYMHNNKINDGVVVLQRVSAAGDLVRVRLHTRCLDMLHARAVGNHQPSYHVSLF